MIQWSNSETDKLCRKSSFPFRVKELYYCNALVAENVPRVTPHDRFEVSIRLDPEGIMCKDLINGTPCDTMFPNVVIKYPNQHFVLNSPEPRDCIAFQYPVECLQNFASVGFLPSETVWHFERTGEIEKLVTDFKKCIYKLYSPGIIDELDWVCFKLFRELLAVPQTAADNEPESIIQNTKIWLQMHYNESISIDNIAARCNMSRATFFRFWKKHEDISPQQYIIQLKLETAAKMLRETQLSVVKIAQTVNFCGMESFHKKFRLKYDMSPAEYRKFHAPR